ncbi:hypothetical protein QTI66_31290 [Variovorax sp. J22R133]|uniref:hypothetical protein n=1 Tax=Variovorax brevis TaxID=3053503 RepID=UPI0025770F21|nr:hypothetical protein [Variovorax sp. J22R133]MDM0116627.1 hypothetical protein [Variovorax sp. J22R133]
MPSIQMVANANAQPQRIEIRQGYDMRFHWVLVGPKESVTTSRPFLDKAACLRDLRVVRKNCNALVEDRTFTAPLESA